MSILLKPFLLIMQLVCMQCCDDLRLRPAWPADCASQLGKASSARKEGLAARIKHPIRCARNFSN